jgi:hypothetical protein
MSNELTLNANLAYSDAEGTEEVLDVVDLIKSVTTKIITRQKVSVPTGTSAASIDFGAVPVAGYVIFLNKDPTNYIDLYTDSGQNNARLDPVNGFAFFKAGADFQSPTALANTAACQMEYLVVST